MACNYLITVTFLCVYGVSLVRSHGRLVEPPSRASMWRYGYKTPEDWADNQQFCGGFTHQWEKHGGKCGVCGDPYGGERDHEAGGKYANGIIVRRYQPGHVILVIVELTAAHLGYFQFRICPNNNPKKQVSQSCLNRRVLQLADDSGTKFYITDSTPKNYEILLNLPEGLECSQCLIQWKYHSGNSWGQEGNNPGCLGCGPQEEFYGCADVAIGNNTLFNPQYYEMVAKEMSDNRTQALADVIADEVAAGVPGNMATPPPADMKLIDLGPHVLPSPPPLTTKVILPTDSEREADEGWIMDFLHEMWDVMFETIEDSLRSYGGVFANATLPSRPAFENQFPELYLEGGENAAARGAPFPTAGATESPYYTTGKPGVTGKQAGIPSGYLRGKLVSPGPTAKTLAGLGRATGGPRQPTQLRRRRRKLRMTNPSLKFRQIKENTNKIPGRLSWTDELSRVLNPNHDQEKSAEEAESAQRKHFLGMGTTHATLDGTLLAAHRTTNRKLRTQF